MLTLLLSGAPVHADPMTDETVEQLVGYLQTNTVNPPGNETEGALYLAEVLDAEGIPWEIWESAPGRGNLVARLEGGDEPPLCLLSHIDVVPSETEEWPAGISPLSGKVDEENVWGRGALDMKAMGILQLRAMVELKRSGTRLDRDLLLLAVADEEIDNIGVHTVLERWDEIGCGYVLNEGGIGVKDVLFEGLHLWPISVGEKGVLWVRMTAHGIAGHGSTPKPDEAPERLLEALLPLAAWDPELSWSPALIELFGAVGETRSGAEKFILTHPWWAKRLLKKTVKSNPLTHAVLIDTVHITGMEGANEPNVVPSEVSALLDCRLLPGTDPDEFLNGLRDLVDDDKVTFEVLSSQEAGVSEWRGDPLYEALGAAIEAHDPEAVVAPALSPGFTDSIYLRELGVTAYGMVPLLVSQEQVATMHGHGEHVPIAELDRGLKILINAITRFAGEEA
ncbi:MAG: M20/M25/M40 family metallo-hydrolase [Proteobacteria bacterium]|nr:M20/M25/M40 family metallo-hydrolase [Pseudomonadota bacterium]MCP4919056.1 M20/M25/M40 family metallo-hydrolase [Pseudomonadota bacterium]